MKRQMRRSFKKIERKLSQAKNFTTNLIRSNSAYSYNHQSTYVPAILPSGLSDDDDDAVFEPTTPIDSSTDDAPNASEILIPCEFCHLQQPSDHITQHQFLCTQNPNYTRRRPPNRRSTTPGHRRRAISDSVSPLPSAPARSRSPSPTEDYPIPSDLKCPITGGLFHDPVVASDGHAYEREAIVRWLQKERKSPITREMMSVDKLNPSRTLKKMADDKRAEWRQKKLLYKYKLDIDVKKTEQIPFIKTTTKAIYRAEWITRTLSSNDSNINLLHLTGENAENIAEIYCRMGTHPNIVRVLGRVEHKDTGILLVQEYLCEVTLSQFMKDSHQTLSINTLDIILYQISSALQYLNGTNIIHGNITADNIFIYHLDDIPENTWVKLTNIGDIEKSTNNTDAESKVSSNEIHSEKSDVYAFGKLALKMYSLQLETNDKNLKERKKLFQRCFAFDQNERPTFNELTETISKFVDEDKYVLKSKSY
ncbi:unnamed protein product [Rotaria sordida]|uniref:Uncharacterized protein n=1 Tax=Rotaria sordida TaxID=392033 RepID=A0A813SBU6_9BILA|nr:unnamed protein product [Rotaria sordida]CAF1257859.1 unnamed protein product [Rotaria sordida]